MSAGALRWAAKACSGVAQGALVWYQHGPRDCRRFEGEAHVGKVVILEESSLVANLFVFVLASFLGLELIRGVSRLLHTPLMSLTNAIASIGIVGSLLITGRPHEDPVITILGTVAIACSSINAVGGFLITERILKMFKKRSN